MKNKTDKQLDKLEKDKIKDVDMMFLECINDLNNRLKEIEKNEILQNKTRSIRTI